MKKTISIIVIIVLLLAAGGALYFLNKYKAFNIPPDERSIVEGQDATTSTSTESVKTGGPFTLPAGFKTETFAEGVKNARVIAVDPKGVILVSQPSEGKVSALPDKNVDGKADEAVTVVGNLNGPHGMAFHCSDPGNPKNCKLYVAEKDALDVFDYDAENLKAGNKKRLLDLPNGSIGTHFTRTLLFTPENENILLIAIGSSCNVCHEDDPRRASIISYDVLTGKSEEYAKGLRNSVFMVVNNYVFTTVNPFAGGIFATEMGRDGLGDDIPPDEINIIEKSRNYGWPICYGKNIHDDQFDKNTYIRNPCMSPFERQSFVDIHAHSAPLGLAFVPPSWPAEYQNNLLVAYHGSWNRSVPTGYKVVRIKFDAKGNYLTTEDFITGWLNSKGNKIGRPVDIKILPSGEMYISDDGVGKIYKVIRL